METPLEDAVLASIKSTFTVEGKTFDTKEEAINFFKKQEKIKLAADDLQVYFHRPVSTYDRGLRFPYAKDLAKFLADHTFHLKEVLEHLDE